MNDAVEVNLDAAAEYLAIATMQTRNTDGKLTMLRMDATHARQQIDKIYQQWKQENGL